jgi:hypothetical protein
MELDDIEEHGVSEGFLRPWLHRDARPTIRMLAK